MSDSSNSVHSLFEDRWTDDHTSRALICFRTDPGSHPLSCLGLMLLNVSGEDDPLERLTVVAREDSTPFFNLDFSVSANELESNVQSLQSEFSDSSTIKDTETIRRKLKPVLEEDQLIETLTDHLVNDRTEAFVESLSTPLRESVFTDPAASIEVYAGAYKEPDRSQETQDTEDTTDEDYLDVKPKIKPSGGTAINDLQPEDVLKVRIVGTDVEQLKPKYQETVDGHNSKSIPLSAKLRDLRPGDSDLITLIVDLGKELLGKGQSRPDSRIHHLNPSRGESTPIDYLGVTIITVIGLLLFIAILLILFPGFLYSMFLGTGGL